MSYVYREQRPKLFTEDGVAMLLKARTIAERFLAETGAFMSGRMFSALGSGDVWVATACLDYLVERKEIVEVTGPNAWGQHRVFAKPLS